MSKMNDTHRISKPTVPFVWGVGITLQTKEYFNKPKQTIRTMAPTVFNKIGLGYWHAICSALGYGLTAPEQHKMMMRKAQ